MNARNTYSRRIDFYRRVSDKLLKNMNHISNLRLLVAGGMIIVFLFANRLGKSLFFWSMSPVGILLYIFLAGNHTKFKKLYKYISILKQINEESIMRVEGRWTEFADQGDEFKDENHHFSHDLDIFGQSSLFQWINTANTYMGRVKLAEILRGKNIDKETILKRQEAIGELSAKLWWRQRLQAEGRMVTERRNTVGDLITWAKNREVLYSNSTIIIALRVLPMVTIASLLLAYGSHIIPPVIPISLILFQIILLFVNAKKRSRDFDLVYKYHNSIKAYSKILRHFEKINFHSKYLKELRMGLSSSNRSAIKQLKKLEIIVDRIGNRNNLVFLPFNIVLLWDYQCLIALENWKRESGLMIEKWLETIGEIEALSSLGNIAQDNPTWSIPEITEKPSIVQAEKLGHPLLTNRRVFNDVDIQNPYHILLITGSNMSGKSTFLRTIGINLVLAYAGAPVCARNMKCSIFSIHTCMRISDNLDKGISSFYGELLRIKEIIGAAKKEKQVFFLLDEIFKGTNSYDRHTGAKKLIKQLEAHGAVGLVSTHDLELGILEKENISIKNYHFQEYYKNGEIHFDYKLRPGISTTRNALYLMKMIGIEE